ncbi:MAG: hypothetical protein LLG06_06155, partial [Desulfobacteraceae bacterium]|nr:hypothetical protein [Desulfobacteraceae bacterium]
MGDGREEILDLLGCGEFEDAIELINRGEALIGREDIDIVLSHFRNRLTLLDPSAGAALRQLRLRIERLGAWRDSGFDPDSLIFPVVMPEGYRGKILLVSFAGGIISKRVCLRSNDLRHIDILRNAEIEAA